MTRIQRMTTITLMIAVLERESRKDGELSRSMATMERRVAATAAVATMVRLAGMARRGGTIRACALALKRQGKGWIYLHEDTKITK